MIFHDKNEIAVNVFRNPRLGFWVNPRKNLILTGFLKRIFPGENAKNRAFYGGEKMKPARLYHTRIKHDTAAPQMGAVRRRAHARGAKTHGRKGKAQK